MKGRKTFRPKNRNMTQTAILCPESGHGRGMATDVGIARTMFDFCSFPQMNYESWEDISSEKIAPRHTWQDCGQEQNTSMFEIGMGMHQIRCRTKKKWSSNKIFLLQTWQKTEKNSTALALKKLGDTDAYIHTYPRLCCTATINNQICIKTIHNKCACAECAGT